MLQGALVLLPEALAPASIVQLQEGQRRPPFQQPGEAPSPPDRLAMEALCFCSLKGRQGRWCPPGLCERSPKLPGSPPICTLLASTEHRGESCAVSDAGDIRVLGLPVSFLLDQGLCLEFASC